MERDFNAWLASLGDAAPVKTLTELRKWNIDHQKAGTLKYGQALLDFSDAMDLEIYRARYEADRAKDLLLAGDARHRRGDADAPARRAVLPRRRRRRHRGAARLPDGDGAVRLTSPTRRRRRFPEGFDAQPAPFGVSFTGTACSEPKLLALAYAFEQATKRRVPPPAMP